MDSTSRDHRFLLSVFLCIQGIYLVFIKIFSIFISAEKFHVDMACQNLVNALFVQNGRRSLKPITPIIQVTRSLLNF